MHAHAANTEAIGKARQVIVCIRVSATDVVATMLCQPVKQLERTHLKML